MAASANAAAKRGWGYGFQAAVGRNRTEGRPGPVSREQGSVTRRLPEYRADADGVCLCLCHCWLPRDAGFPNKGRALPRQLPIGSQC